MNDLETGLNDREDEERKHMRHLWKIALFFSLTLIWVSVLAFGVLVASIVFLEYDPGYALALVPFSVAATVAGQKYAKLAGDVPAKPVAWGYAFALSSVYLWLSLLVGLMVTPQEMETILSAEPGIVAGILAIVFVISVLICRWVFMFGAKSHFKALSRG